MKQQPYVSGTQIFKVLLVLSGLAITKLVLMAYLGLVTGLSRQQLAEGQVPVSGPQVMVRKDRSLLPAVPAAAQAATAQAATTARAATARAGPDKARSEGADSLSGMGSLAKQWQSLRQKQQELRRKEKDLQELEQRLDQKLAREAALKKKLESILKEVEVLKDKKIKHLVDVYSNMEPKQAAKVLETLDEKIAVKILAGMRGRTAGEILSFVRPEKAAKLSEALTAFQTPFGQ